MLTQLNVSENNQAAELDYTSEAGLSLTAHLV